MDDSYIYFPCDYYDNKNKPDGLYLPMNIPNYLIIIGIVMLLFLGFQKNISNYFENLKLSKIELKENSYYERKLVFNDKTIFIDIVYIISIKNDLVKFTHKDFLNDENLFLIEKKENFLRTYNDYPNSIKLINKN